MTTNLRPTTPTILRTPDGFIHNISTEGDIWKHHVCDEYALLRLNEACPHGFLVMGNNRGPWMATASGRRHYFLDPHPSEIVIEDIAHHLSNICRYNGACREFYSVAEHSVRVATAVFHHHYKEHFAGRDGTVAAPPMDLEAARRDALAALLHDASEAYLGDMVYPLKVIIGKAQKSPWGISYESNSYHEMENVLTRMINIKFCGGVTPKEVRDLIRHYDLALLKHETSALIPNAAEQWEEWDDLPNIEGLAPIEPWSPSEARVRFMTAFAQYGGQS